MRSRIPPTYLFGEVSKRRTIAGLVLSKTAYPPGNNVPTHWHEHARFVVVLAGSFSEAYERRTRTCGPSTVIFRPPGELHSERFHHRGGSCLSIDIDPSWLNRMRQASITLDSSIHFSGGFIAQLALRLHQEFNQRDEAAPLAIEGLMLEIAAEASRQRGKLSGSRPPRWLEQARERLHAEFPHRRTVAEIADSVGVHPVHLARVFHQQYGCTIGEYLRRLRIEFACREIAASDAPLSAIALAAGFSDQSHFSRHFRRGTGLTPREYRSLCRR